MARKTVQGLIRDKAKTKQRLLNAVGKVIKSKGHHELKVTKIATAAGLDKKLIYEYFGSTDKLINEYIKSQDYWNTINSNDLEIDISDGGREACKTVFTKQFEQLQKRKELQKIILWELSENKKLLRDLADSRELVGEMLFKNVTDPFFEKNARKYRATMAILVAGIYYLTLHTETNGSSFCGLNLKEDKDRKEIEGAIIDIIENAYEGYKD